MSKFTKAFLSLGIPFSILVTLFCISAHRANGILGLLYGLGAGIVFGLVQTAIFYFVAKLLHHETLRFILLSILLCITGAVITILVLIVVEDYLPYGNWHQIQELPAEAAEFVGESPFTSMGGAIYIKTKSGDLYSYNCSWPNPCEWKKESSISTPASTENDRRCRNGYEARPTPLTPGTVVASHDVNICGIDYILQTKYIILDNGSLWEWSRLRSATEAIGSTVSWVIAGLAAGFLATIVLSIGRKQGKW